jgi:flagellar biosynthesis protein FlhF
MQIKTYKAASMKEVLAQIKTEMGPNAVIVSTRQFKDDTYGLMTKPVVEVTAAVDYDAMRGGTPQTPKVITLPPQIKVHDDVTHLSAEITELKGMMKTLLTQHRGRAQPGKPLAGRIH